MGTRGTASYVYENKSGSSHHEVKDGMVLRLHGKKVRYNKHFKARVSHTVYFWIQRVNRRRTGERPCRQKLTLATCYVPDFVGKEEYYLGHVHRVVKEYVVSRLDGGFDLVSKNCHCNGSKWSWGNFYRAIGVIKK